MQIFKRVVIFLMLISFLSLAVTGIIKFPKTHKYFDFVYESVPAYGLSQVHDWSGVVLVVLVVIHLIMKREWFFKNSPANQERSRRTSKWAFIILILVVIGAGAYYSVGLIGSRRAVDLAAVEISEYQGEKLGSLKDIPAYAVKGIQHLDRNQYELELAGLIEHPVRYGYADLLEFQSYQKVVQLNCVGGWSVKALWKGILVRDLFQGLGIRPEANTVIFYAADGYSTSFPLDYILDKDIIMAYNLNGVELPEGLGFPFQLVAEEKWGYKWIKWITKIEISDNPDYKGFWESRGYDNKGDLTGPRTRQK